jgi:ketosteroid isomerase-like protein
MTITANPVINTRSETEIRRIIDKWLTAVREKDINAIMEYYAEDVVAFDAILQLQFKGKPAYKAHWEYCMNMCPGPMLFDMHQLVIAADENIAFVHGLTHCGGTNEKGEEQRCWMRVSAGFRKINDKWLAVHEHFSSPFDMDTGKALFDAQP